MRLEILISTYGADGIRRLAQKDVLPRCEGVGYLISWQRGDSGAEIPPALIRPDVRIVVTGSKGSGANRANCINHAKGDWCLIADDDLVFDMDRIKELMSQIESYQHLDFAVARSSGADNKTFPDEGYPIFPLRRRHFVTEFELLVNLGSVRKAHINYNPHLGAGVDEYTAGEGAVLMYEMKRKGLKGRYFPITIVDHPGLTTSQRIAMNDGVLRAEGLVIALEYPLTGIVRIPLVAYRRWRRFGGSLARAVLILFQGFMAGISKKKSLDIGQQKPT